MPDHQQPRRRPRARSGSASGIPALISAPGAAPARGTGLAITGLVTSVLALVLVVVTQLFFAQGHRRGRTGHRGGHQRVGRARRTGRSQPLRRGRCRRQADAPDIVPLGVPAQVGDYAGDRGRGRARRQRHRGQRQRVQRAADRPVRRRPADRHLPRAPRRACPGWDLSAIFHGTDARQYSDSECSVPSCPTDAMDAPTLNNGGIGHLPVLHGRAAGRHHRRPAVDRADDELRATTSASSTPSAEARRSDHRGRWRRHAADAPAGRQQPDDRLGADVSGRAGPASRRTPARPTRRPGRRRRTPGSGRTSGRTSGRG